jgi:cell division GTPase FtsZ
MKHMAKYLLINRMFQGKSKLMPVFNRENNEDLLISIQTAGVYNGGKDKRGEKLAETSESKLESRTDGSDAFDTLCIGCEVSPETSSMYAVTSSF